MTTLGDHEREPEEFGGYDFGQEDAIGREMWEVRQTMQAADDDHAWVPAPSGLESYLCLRDAGSTVDGLYMIALPGGGGKMPAICFAYTDVRGREVLPMFRTVERAEAYVERQTGVAGTGARALGCRELGGLGTLVDAFLRVDLVVVDPDPVPHPGRCATEGLGRVARGGR